MGVKGGMKQHCLLFGLCLVTLALLGSAGADKTVTVTVVGTTECLDCAVKNIKVDEAFKGLRVAIKCKSATTGLYETKGVSHLDKSGNFHVKLAVDDLLHGESKACLAEIRDRSNKACPKPDPLTLTLASTEKDQHTFTVGHDGKLQIISSICNSATFWPPKWDPFHKKSYFFSHPFFKKPYTYTPPVPEYKPPTPVPVYKPPTTYQPPVYKPTPTPVYKPTPTPVPVYKPTPSVPVYNPTPSVPVYNPTPSVPVYKPPYYHPHPKFGFPPIYKAPYGSHPWTKYFHKKPYFPPADNKN